MEDQSEPVQVFLRIRPEFDEIQSSNSKLTPEKMVKTTSYGNLVKVTSASMSPTTLSTCVTASDDHTIRLMPPDGIYASRKSVSAVDDKIYHFDKVFSESATQEEIYESVAEQVLATVRGYNTTIFAYGVTGSGKSYTMTGNKTAPGIIPRAIGDIFKSIDKAASESDVYFFVRLSYVELYNNTFRNLLEHVAKDHQNLGKTSNSNTSMSGLFPDLDDLDASAAYEAQFGPSFAYGRASSNIPMRDFPGSALKGEKIEVRESQSAGVFLSGTNLRFPVTSAVEAFQLIAKGNKYRATASTNCNEESSRSHAILTFHVESRISSLVDGVSKSEIRIGKIHLVDLAGSERLTLSGADGETLIETKNINSSLTALGDVLSALSKNATIMAQQQKVQRGDLIPERQLPTLVPVPYRNSKLTHLLKDSLGGNSKTIMITTIRKTSEYYQQTAVSLMYSARAKKVRNRSTVNRNVIGDSGIHNFQTEFERLKKSLEDRQVEFEKLRLAQMKDAKENSSLKARLQEMKMANEAEKKLLEQQVSQLISSQKGQISVQKEKISLLQNALQDELTLSQNRIAEQEQEIKWLKKALDETNQSNSKDQMEKMQHVVDVWQNQAKTANKELSTVLRQAEELKNINTSLEERVRELEQQNKQLSDEVDERDTEIADLTKKYTHVVSEFEGSEEALKASKKAYDELRVLIKDHIKENSERETLLKENTKLIQSLEIERVSLREKLQSEAAASKEKIGELNSKLHELEKENADLNGKLNANMKILEKKAQETIHDANTKISKLELELDESKKFSLELQREMEKFKTSYNDLKSSTAASAEQKDKAFVDLEAALRRELQNASKLSGQLLAAQTENDNLKDKMSKQQKKTQEKLDMLAKRLQEKEDVINHLDNELAELKALKDQDKMTLMNEFERILQEKRAQHNTELQDLRKQLEQGAQLKELEHQNALQKLEQEFKEKESLFQDKLRETEGKVRSMIEKEINDGISQLQERHRAEIVVLKEQHAKDHDDGIRSLREVLLKEKADALNDQESLLTQRFEISLEEKLDSLKRTLLLEKEEALTKLKAQCNAEMFRKLEELEGQKDAHLAEVKKELEDYLSSNFSRDKKDALEKVERMHKQRLDEELKSLQVEFDKKLREKEQQLAEQLQEAKAASAREKEEALSNLKQTYAVDTVKKIREVQEKKQAEKAAALSSLDASLREEHEKDKADALERLERVLKLKQDEELRRVEAAHKGTVHDMEIQHQELMEDLRRQLSAEKEESLGKAKQQYSLDLQRKLQEASEQHDIQIRQLRADLEAQYSGQYSSEVKEALEKQEKSLKARHEENVRRLEASYSKQMADIETAHIELLESTRKSLTAEKEEAISKLRSVHAQELARKLGDLEQEKNTKAQEAQEALALEFEAAKHAAVEKAEKVGRLKLEEELRKADIRMAKQLQDTEESYKEQLELLTNRMLADKEEALAKAKLLHASELSKKLQEAAERHDIQMQQLRADLEAQYSGQYSSEVKEALEKQEKSLKARHEENVRRLETSYYKQLGDAESSHLEELESAKRLLLAEKDEAISKFRTQSAQELARKLNELEQVLTKRFEEERNALLTEHEADKQAAVEKAEKVGRLKLEDELRRFELKLANQLQDLHDEYKDKIDQLTHSLAEEKMDALAKAKQQHFADMQRKLSDLDQVRLAAIEKEKADLESELRRLHKQELAAALDSQEREFKRLLLDSRTTLTNEHREMLTAREEEFMQELERLRKALMQEKEEALAKLKTQYTADLARRMQDLADKQGVEMSALRSDLEAVSAAEKRDALEKLERSLGQKYKDQIARLEAAYEIEKQQLLETAAAEKDELRTMLSSDVEISVARLKSQHSADLQRKLAEVEGQYKSSMRELEEVKMTEVAERDLAIDTLRTQIQELTAKHRNDLEASLADQQKLLMEKSRQEIDRLRAKQAEIEANHQWEVARLSSAHAAELNQQRTKLEELQVEHSQEMALAEERFNGEMQHLKAQHDRTKKLLEDRLLAQEEEHRVVLEQALESSRDRSDKAIKDAAAKFQLELKALMDTHEAELVDLAAKHDSEKQELSSHLQEEKESTRGEYLHQIYVLETQAKDLEIQLKEAHNSDIDQLSSRHREELRRIATEHRIELNKKDIEHSESLEKLRDQIRALNNENAQHLVESREKTKELQQTVDGLKVEIAAILQTHVQEKEQLLYSADSKFQQELRTLKSEFRQKEMLLQSELDTVKFTLTRETQSAKQAKDLHENYVAEMEARHAQETQRLQQRFQQEIDELKASRLQDLLSLKSQSNGEVTQIKALYDGEIAMLKEKTREYDSYKLKKESELLSLQQQLFESQANYQSISQKHNRLYEDYEALKNYIDKLEEKYKVETEQRVNDLLNNHDVAFLEYQQKERQKLKIVEDNFHLEKSNLAGQIADMQHKIETVNRLFKDKSELYDKLYQDYVQLTERNKSKEKELQDQVMRSNQGSHALETRIKQLEGELQRLQDEQEKALQKYTQMLEEKDAQFHEELQRQLAAQQGELQDNYLSAIKEQMNLMVQMIKAQADGRSSENHFQELQNRFLDLVQDLPDLWQKKHGGSLLLNNASNNLLPTNSAKPPAQPSSFGSTTLPPFSPEKPHGTNGHGSGMPRTPIHVLANASADFDSFPAFPPSLPPTRTSAGAASMPWNSPSQRASPTDQLIAAILDGDVQGIRSIVKGKGDDLQSPYWSGVSKSILPLHRALSGLHFHGKKNLLISALEVLLSLKADILAVDHMGNNVLHKALQVCSSTSVTQVVRLLIERGAEVRGINKEGDTPLHVECRRLRTASLEVLDLLTQAGAGVNTKNHSTPPASPLTLLLLRAAGSTPLGASLIGLRSGNGTGEDEGLNSTSPPDERAPRSSGRQVWVRAADKLIRLGAKWDPHYRHPAHSLTQLHLMVLAYPPPRDESAGYRTLLRHALENGQCDPFAEEGGGRSALFLLCEGLAHCPPEAAPDVQKMVSILLEHMPGGVGGADRGGRTVLDIPDTPPSALGIIRPLLTQTSHLAPASKLRARGGGVSMGMGGYSDFGASPPLNLYPPAAPPSRVPSSIVAATSYGAREGGKLGGGNSNRRSYFEEEEEDDTPLDNYRVKGRYRHLG